MGQLKINLDLLYKNRILIKEVYRSNPYLLEGQKDNQKK